MREIKFRAWDGKLMYKVAASDLTSIEFCLYAGDTFREEPEPLMQYTGLKDKNGKEIYEGDIVEVEISYGLNPPNLGRAVVEFRDLSWRFEFLNKGDEEECYAKEWHNQHTEVIGNIYEHPELLK
jgi:uncharacterized phage protein (TIGR01671 family)